MSGHADTIRATIRHDKMRVLDSWGHPSSCPGCAADVALDALLAERLLLSELLNDAIVYLDRGEFPGDGIMAKNLREALAGDTECVCGEINTRHCPVHGQGDTE